MSFSWGGHYSTYYWWGACYSAHPPTCTRPSRPPSHLGAARGSVETRLTRAGPPHGRPQLGTAPHGPAQRRPALLWGPRGVAGRCVPPSQVRAARGAQPPSARRKGLRVHGHPPRSRAATLPGPGRSGPGRPGPGLLGLFLRQPLAVPALPAGPFLVKASAHTPERLRSGGGGSAAHAPRPRTHLDPVHWEKDRRRHTRVVFPNLRP